MILAFTPPSLSSPFSVIQGPGWLWGRVGVAGGFALAVFLSVLVIGGADATGARRAVRARAVSTVGRMSCSGDGEGGLKGGVKRGGARGAHRRECEY